MLVLDSVMGWQVQFLNSTLEWEELVRDLAWWTSVSHQAQGWGVLFINSGWVEG